MKFGNNPYELPTNTDLEAVLKKNLDHINPVEMKEKYISDEKRLFPFWVPVKDAEGVSFTDYKEYLSTKDRLLEIKQKKDNVGIVQPKDVSKSYDGSDIIEKINKVIDTHNKAKVFDNTGAVIVVKNALDGTKTSKQVIDNKVGEVKKVEVDSNAKTKTGVGAVVVPNNELKDTKTKEQVIDNKVGEPELVKVEKSAKSKTGVGAVVVPKADMPKQTKVDVTDGSKKVSEGKVGIVKPKADMPKQTVVDVTDGSKKTGDSKVGAVKPKSEMGTQTNVSINFDKFKTSDIKAPTYK